MYKILSHLMKLFPSAAERATFNQACGLNHSTWGGVREVCLHRYWTARPLHAATARLGDRPFGWDHRGSRNGSPTLRMQRRLPEHCPPATTALAQPSYTSAAPPWVETHIQTAHLEGAGLDQGPFEPSIPYSLIPLSSCDWTIGTVSRVKRIV